LTEIGGAPSSSVQGETGWTGTKADNRERWGGKREFKVGGANRTATYPCEREQAKLAMFLKGTIAPVHGKGDD